MLLKKNVLQPAPDMLEAGKTLNDTNSKTFHCPSLLLHISSKTSPSYIAPIVTMPASAGRVRMPHNNRMSTSATLKTHAIWQTAIGHDPYANSSETQESAEATAAAKQKAQSVMDLARSQNLTDGAKRNEFTAQMYNGLKKGKQRRADMLLANDNVDPKLQELLEGPSSSSEDEYVVVKEAKDEKKKSASKKKKHKRRKKRSTFSSSDDKESSSSSDESSSSSEEEDRRRERRRHRKDKKKRKKHRKRTREEYSSDSSDSEEERNRRKRKRKAQEKDRKK